MRKPKNLARSLGKSMVEKKVASQRSLKDTQLTDGRAVVIIKSGTAVASAEQLLDFVTTRDSVPEVIWVTTPDGTQAAVCVISPEEYTTLRRWIALERGPEVELDGEHVRCLQIKHWKSASELEFKDGSPLSNPKFWADARKTYAAGYLHVLPSSPVVIEDGDTILMSPERLQELVGRATTPEVIRMTSVTQGAWDTEPIREVAVCIVDPKEEARLYRRAEIDVDAPMVWLDGKGAQCLEVKTVKPVSEWGS